MRSSLFHKFYVGLPAGAGLTAVALHYARAYEWIQSTGLCSSNARPPLALAITLYPVTTPAAQLAVIAVAVAVIVGFLIWSKQATSASFFHGALAGNGIVLSFDIVWVHWIFGLHHLTNTQMDLVLEPLLVLVGFVFLWFAITRERRQTG